MKKKREKTEKETNVAKNTTEIKFRLKSEYFY